MAITIDGSTGWTYSDDIKQKFGTSDDLEIFHSGANKIVSNNSMTTYIAADQTQITNAGITEPCAKFVADGAVELYYDNSKKLRTYAGGVRCEEELNVQSDLYIANDNKKLFIGAGDDLQIYHSGSHSHVLQNGTGNLYLDAIGASVNLRSGDNAGGVHNSVVCNMNAGVELYYDNSKKFETKPNGAEVTGHFDPAAGNSYDLGYDHRWRILYTNNAVDTSDRNEKQNIINSDLGLDFVNKLTPVSYQWKDVDNLGSKKQYGLIAQDVEKVILDSGKTLDDFGAIDKREGKSMGLSYNQLISPLIKAVQELSAEVETLKTKVAALEAG